MLSKRTFFKRLFTAAAVIAIAPQIAFAKLPPLPKPDLDEIFELCVSVCYARKGEADTIDVFTDSIAAGKIKQAMVRFYEGDCDA